MTHWRNCDGYIGSGAHEIEVPKDMTLLLVISDSIAELPEAINLTEHERKDLHTLLSACSPGANVKTPLRKIRVDLEQGFLF